MINRIRKYFLYALTWSVILPFVHERTLYAESIGKIDVGPAYVHLDIIESKKTIKELDMAAFKADVSCMISSKWCVKPSFLYGKERGGELVNFGFAFGRCVPFGERLIFTPTVGVSYTNLGTSVPINLGEYGTREFFQRFHGVAPFVGLEISYKIASNWRAGASVQYAWSYSKTKIKHLLVSHGYSSGPTYGFMLEYDLNQDWSVNIAGAYNESFSKEKHGLRGRGLKAGLVRWF